MNNNYFLKDGYAINAQPYFFNDSVEDSMVYQLEVYKHAASLLVQHKLDSVLDIGCGVGTKLQEMILPHTSNITGVDSDHAIPECQEMYSFGNWIAGNLEDENFKIEGTYDLIISADVIEHLIDPDKLLRLIADSSHSNSRVVISTPERDLRRGFEHMGPPQNTAHVREWNGAELRQYLESRGFRVDDFQIVDLREGMKTCQMFTGTLPEFCPA